MKLYHTSIVLVFAFGCGGSEFSADPFYDSSTVGAGGSASAGGAGGTTTASGASPASVGSGGSQAGVGVSSATGGQGTTTTSGSGGGPAGTAGAGGFGGSPDAGCTPTPVDLYIMQSKTGTMDCPTSDDACQNVAVPSPPSRWEAAVTGLTDMMRKTPDNYMGLGFFGLQNGSTSCQWDVYKPPVVAIGPNNRIPIKSSLDQTQPSGGAPLVQGLQGAVAYVSEYNLLQRGVRGAALILVTDGYSNGCGTDNNVNGAASQARSAYNTGVWVIVAGVGNTQALEQIAMAGSGGHLHHIATTGDVAGGITGAVQNIQAAQCP